jgi:HPt (histidine-containing phosphotransfer) domain-containing protein
VQELAATADQVVVIKGQAAGHKRAHNAAAAGAQRLVQQVAQLEQLAVQLAERLPQEAASRKVGAAGRGCAVATRGIQLAPTLAVTHGASCCNE